MVQDSAESIPTSDQVVQNKRLAKDWPQVVWMLAMKDNLYARYFSDMYDFSIDAPSSSPWLRLSVRWLVSNLVSQPMPVCLYAGSRILCCHQPNDPPPAQYVTRIWR